MFGDIDLIGLEDFLTACVAGDARIVHTKVVVPSRLGMSLFMSAFEDLMSMKTRAFLVKDIDPSILQRLLGTRRSPLNSPRSSSAPITLTRHRCRPTPRNCSA